MSNGILLGVVLPVALFVIMLGMGMTLKLADFSRIFQLPVAVLTGLAGQMLLVPLLAFVVVSVFTLPPELAIGLMILSFAPGGATSNMMTFLSKGDVALSITLTAFASLLTPFTIPWLSQWALDHWLGEVRSIDLPVLQIMMRLIVITVVPVSLGMWLYRSKPDLAARLVRVVKPLSIAFLMFVIVSIVIKNWQQMPEFLAAVGPAAVALNVMALACGYLISAVMKLPVRQRITNSIEVGVQNGGTALLITGGVLGNTMMSVSPVIYGILMLVPSLLFGMWWGKYLLKKEHRELHHG
ncbi:bile acid:sodium symporter family protein [Oceanospirillum sediminis]|uniref:Bile acid:sodium symporter family protein n=1 Tax=Oceanospirillum sediminis TaxID=2760088 RepID=A0A839IIQ5_9GAMM|nr:bile acid:sodium symporter family protein [Oceanospirillum sediminis]MBB1485213.1 bile acid:sodium symporter family protein [Oceanospirillum sediminis]